MRHLITVAFYILLPIVFSSSVLRVKRQQSDTNSPCVCVPYYQCGPDGKIDTSGTFQLDPRFDPAEPNPTCSGVDICCGVPDDFETDDKSSPEPRPGPTPEPKPERPYEPPTINPPVEPPHGGGSDIPIPSRPPGLTGCGVKRINPLDPRIDTDTRITGKDDKPENTFYGEFPWMVAIFKVNKGKKEFLCGGSLISEHVVLTAAHHIAKLEPHEIVIRAGDWDSRDKVEPIPHQDRQVDRVSLHKEFDSGNLRNDIALLFVDNPFVLGDTIDTICITNEHFEPKNCQATGWGVNSFSDKGQYQPILKKVYLPLVERDVCQKKLRGTRLGDYFKLHKSFICAGGLINQDTCAGDGGGPLVCASTENPQKYAQIGIVSWGIGCGNETPGVYASVKYFYDWIASEMKW